MPHDKHRLTRALSCLVTLAVLGGGGYLAWHYLGRPDLQEIQDTLTGIDVSDFEDVLDDLGDIDWNSWRDQDPFLSSNATNAWSSSGTGGLELELINALDDTWQVELENAVSDWDNGTPDPLTLTVTKANVDYECKQKDGVMKICNGNYGDSGWLGINEIIKTSSSGTIISSVAKMNEYYLHNANLIDRQYTMCHEIGHGFGLPHTDENFFNPNLGNCMDYTDDKESNLHPDEGNFQRLAGLYGTVNDNGRRRQRRQQRGLLRSPKSPPTTTTTSVWTPNVTLEYEQAWKELALMVRPSSSSTSSSSSPSHSWRVLEEQSHGVDMERNLGEDLVLQVHMLWAETQ